MPLTPGTKLGPYEIISALGAGAMGEVYRARDTRLERTVAIKVLPESLANDPDRLQRFEQEARVLSTLNHPNLLAIYDVGVQGGTHYLVSEFLEGQTLREELESGALPQRKVSDYALKIANGLAAAHDKGIVHRDLKPENIFVTRDDHVKILDFGLAKLSQEVGSLNASNATLTSPALTAAGTVMGTVGYMSPEQVRGQVVDSRSDIFSLGAILYEMATGKRAFKGDSGVETMNAILKEDPPELDAGSASSRISPGFDRIIRHCLEKNPANRFQSARDLGFAISALSGTGSSSAPVISVASAAAPKNRRLLPWLVAGAMAVVAISTITLAVRGGKESGHRAEFSIPISEDVGSLAISPDGTMLSFVSPSADTGANMVCIQHLGGNSVTFLPGTENASYPFWSPDDKFVGFFANSKLKKVAISGGLPQVLAPSTIGRGGSWNRDGVILFTPQATGWMMRVNQDGSGLASATQKTFGLDQGSDRFPTFLPDGDHFLYLQASFAQGARKTDGIYIDSLSKGEKKLVLSTHSSPGFANGYLFFADDKHVLRRIAMDPKTGETHGEPELVASTVGYFSSTQWAVFSTSENGTVVFNPTTTAAQSQLTWFDRSGKDLGTVGDAGVLANPMISPDQTRVAVDIADIRASNVNEWTIGLKDATASRFTFDSVEDDDGIWSRDGETIAYRKLETSTSLNTKQARGLQPPKKFLDSATTTIANDDVVPTSWTFDGKQILCTWQPVTGGEHQLLVNVSDGKFAPFLSQTANVTNGQISPDGKWAAYASDESGDWEIYVSTFPGGEGKWQVSRGGGTEPRWRADGKEIFYIGASSTFTAVPVTSGDTFAPGNPTPLFRTQLRAQVSSTDLFSYDVSKDGQRFLANRYTRPPAVVPVHVILNATSPAQK
jgi:eukaryotic-like serine/threonine-protein kinase